MRACKPRCSRAAGTLPLAPALSPDGTPLSSRTKPARPPVPPASERLVTTRAAIKRWHLLPADLHLLRRHVIAPVREGTGVGRTTDGLPAAPAPRAAAAAAGGDGEIVGDPDPRINYEMLRLPGFRMRDVLPAVRVRFGGAAGFASEGSEDDRCVACVGDARAGPAVRRGGGCRVLWALQPGWCMWSAHHRLAINVTRPVAPQHAAPPPRPPPKQRTSQHRQALCQRR